MQNTQFLQRLQAEAALQARLERDRFLPAQLDFLTSFIGRYPWQVITVLSGVTALAMFGLK